MLPPGHSTIAMASGLRQRAGGWLVVLTAGILLLRAGPLIRAYAHKLTSRHPREVVAGALVAGLVAIAVLALALWRRPRAAVAALAAIAVAMLLLSGNAVPALVAAAILAVTAILGDAAFRIVAGEEAAPGDLHAAFALGVVAAGTLVLALGEANLFGPLALAALAAVLVLLRRRRLGALLRLLRGSARLPFGDAPRGLEAAWLALASLFLLATSVGALGPDLSWDGLAYHLPEARDIAESGRVRPLPDLHPQSLLWRGHDAYLALGFLFGSERTVQLLQFTGGLAVFGAALALARRLGWSGASPLIVLSLAAFPTAMLQLRSAYVDWPAALAVTAAAAQLAARPPGAGRLRVAGVLFGGAVAIKIFALFAAPALLVLALRSRPSIPRLAAAAACMLVPLGPWLAWSHARGGSIAAPYAASPRELLQRVSDDYYFARSPATGEARPVEGRGLLAFAGLPHDVVFHSSRFEANGDGYNGVLVLLLLLGLAGWDVRHALIFLAVTLPFLVPWSLLYHPSIRFLITVYPLYAVFMAEGLRRLAGGFRSAPGRAAGIAVLAAAAAFPVHFGSSGLEWRAALGRATREEVLSARLPSLAFASRLRAEDRVVFVGENDRFHCPAAAVWRSEFSPVAAWKADLEAWSRGLEELGITAVVWRSDRAAFPVPELLGERLIVDAENGPARLFRVSPP
jgi:hypothetical protein